MKVLGKNLLIVPMEEDTKSKAGLFMTATDKNELRYKKATVVSVGTDVANVKPGAFIYFDRAAGHSIRVNEDLYTVILERDIVVVL